VILFLFSLLDEREKAVSSFFSLAPREGLEPQIALFFLPLFFNSYSFVFVSLSPTMLTLMARGPFLFLYAIGETCVSSFFSFPLVSRIHPLFFSEQAASKKNNHAPFSLLLSERTSPFFSFFFSAPTAEASPQ